MSKQEFIESIAGYVIKYANNYGIECHSAIIAQAILESGWGESKLSSVYHNYFGLKCGTKWTGKSVNMTTQEEYAAGTLTTIKDNFRVYDSMEEGVKGYFEFIQLSRYQNLKGITDPKTYLETIKADGYATSSKYVDNTYAVVIQYNLTQYDEEAETMARDRSTILVQANKWMGATKGSTMHKEIIDTYNGHKPLARGYKVTYTDAYCATYVSAVAIKCGYTDIIPTECSCGQMIALFQQMGCWVENDAYTPKPGDVVFYDWDDNGVGDNTGWPDHVGYVDNVVGTNIVVNEGNMSGGIVGKRTLQINGKYIRGYGTPKYTGYGSGSTITVPIKSIDVIAKEVLAGSWGNGDDRKSRLTAAGYNYDEVQAKVNELVKGNNPKPVLKDVTTIAKEVIAGKWGNGTERKAALEKAGYNYNDVQSKVNQLLKAESTTYDVDAIAREVIAGKWGNGEARKKALEAKGYNYNEVQARVNQLM